MHIFSTLKPILSNLSLTVPIRVIHKNMFFMMIPIGLYCFWRFKIFTQTFIREYFRLQDRIKQINRFRCLMKIDQNGKINWVRVCRNKFGTQPAGEDILY